MDDAADGREGASQLPRHLSALIGSLHGPPDLGRNHNKYLAYPDRDESGRGRIRVILCDTDRSSPRSTRLITIMSGALGSFRKTGLGWWFHPWRSRKYVTCSPIPHDAAAPALPPNSVPLSPMTNCGS